MNYPLHKQIATEELFILSSFLVPLLLSHLGKNDLSSSCKMMNSKETDTEYGRRIRKKLR